VTFLRLTPGHVVAAVAALVLLLFMALDWYSTDEGEEARRIQGLQGEPEPGVAGEVTREVNEEAEIRAEEEESTAWTAGDALDRVILVLLLLSVILALLAAALRAADRRYPPPPIAPSAAAAAAAALGAVLLAVRIIDVGAAEAGGAVELGAPLGLLALGAIAIGSGLAARAERAPEPERDGARSATV
jgi:hypothetical protein